MSRRRPHNPPTAAPAMDSAESAPDPAQLAAELAVTQAEQMGADVSSRYAQLGARWLSDPTPSRLDSDLIERLARQGFRRDRLAEIRVHRGSRAQAAADALQARAFAVGEADIYFGTGQFDPSSAEGRAVIAHEVAHVAPPDFAIGLGGAGPGGAGAPVLNERKRHGTLADEDSSDGEATERTARAAEARVFAEESSGPPAELAVAADADGAATGASGRSRAARIEPHVLEGKVMALLARMQRTDAERSGHG